ncbi:MAG: chemotaxis protein CheW [Spirochaetia bacterium]
METVSPTNNSGTHHNDALAPEFKMVTFILAEKEYGVDIMAVKEIQKGSRFTYVPNAPYYVRGVYNLRGEIIPVIDLRNFFGLPKYEVEQTVEDILILRQNEAIVGVIVDHIQKVVSVLHDEIQPAHPLFADVVGLNYIYGVVEKEHELYVILDTGVILGHHKADGEEEEDEEEVTSSAGTTQTVVADSVSQPVAADPIATAPVSQPVAADPIPTAPVSQPVAADPIPTAPVSQPVAADPIATAPVSQPVAADPIAVDPQEEDEGVVSDSFYENLFNFGKFCPSELNQDWLTEAYEEWSINHGGGAKLDKEAAASFLAGFYSKHSQELWPADMLEDFCNLVSQEDQKITHIWNVNSQKGHVAYSVAGGLFLRDKRCKVYATDSDLMSITGAPGLTFDAQDVESDLKLAMVEGPKGLQFSNEVKNTIIFEYHDIANDHSFPRLDVVIVRDVLSFVDEDVFMKFFERIDKLAHPGTLLIVGDNEKIMNDEVWSPVESEYFSVYRKIV